MPDDHHLLLRYHRCGDAEAFRALVQAHAGMVFATANRVTRDAGLAEDVAQEVFLALARSGQHAIESVAAWLHHVAWQKARDAVRKKSRRQRNEAMAAEVMHEAPSGSWLELEPLVDEALAELPDEARAILIEHFLEQRSQQDLAQRFRVSQSTVSRQIESSVQLLRDHLRRKGVICTAGLATLLATNAHASASAKLTASLGKLAISGIGAGSTASVPAIPLLTSLTTMTTTTKILLGTSTVLAAAGLAWTLQNREPAAPPKEPMVAKAKPVPQAVRAPAPAAGRERAPAAPVERPRKVLGQAEQKVFDRMFASWKSGGLQTDAEFNEAFQRLMREVMLDPSLGSRLNNLDKSFAKTSDLQINEEKQERLRQVAAYDQWPEADIDSLLEAVVTEDKERLAEVCEKQMNRIWVEVEFLGK